MGLDQFDTVLAFSGVMLTLSLLITVIVQMAAAVLGLRGNNLKWGVEHIIRQLDPKFGLDAFAAKLADAVLTHPVLAHTGARRATAIRVTEMIDVLQDIAANPDKSKGKGLTEDQRKQLAAALTHTVPAVGAESAAHVAAVTDSLLKVFPSAGSTVKSAVSQALSEKRQVEVEIAKWFNTAMDRTTERFILHTRWVTAVAAALVCLFLHIDSLKIFGQLSADKALREQFVQRSATLLDSANEALVLPAGQAAKALASDALKEMKDDLPKELQGKIAEGLITRQQGREWIESAIPEDTEKQAAAIKSFEQHFNAVSAAHLKALGNAFNRNETILRDTTLTIVPTPNPPVAAYFRDGRHFLGVLMSILLLSLGAPFWFNALKQLTALRPVLAKKVEGDKPSTPTAAT
jgi:hypothetical protein